MLDPVVLKKRLATASEEYLKYAPTIARMPGVGEKYSIGESGNEYIVDLDRQTCTCSDNDHRGDISPCKHLIVIWIYKYFKIRLEEETECN
ncbi:MAG: hypothetical protein PHC43_01645 [Candidatus Marinimicrobia bacterium]|jgi:hypothetical protein|nr:hypothetical protein [Candidatus Neomarinimicrobiota bacterium]MDD5230012.1 hypothetical protein [Candidatus Neomarinimicrobiota bacterium]MDD5540497.1 hypothetical protein [Candidatus Neomarinimicrobiota bacterium]